MKFRIYEVDGDCPLHIGDGKQLPDVGDIIMLGDRGTSKTYTVKYRIFSLGSPLKDMKDFVDIIVE